MFALDRVLFAQDTQIQFIEWFKTQLNVLPYKNMSILLECSTNKAVSLNTKKRKKEKHRNAIASILNDDVEEKIVNPRGAVDAYLNWVIQQNPLQMTWCVLSIIYVSDTAKSTIATSSHPHVVHDYLVPFNERFERHLCGVLCHSKQQKKSTLREQAKSPIEIVLHEWLFAKKCFMKQAPGE
jgi:hypothetical protein